jgi:antirestriction protein ArdC
MATKLAEVMEASTALIVRAIRAGEAGEWEPPWRIVAGGLHHSAETEKPYRGANQLILMLTAMVTGFESPRWGTYKAWRRIGAQVRKGEHAAAKLVKWGTWGSCPVHGKGRDKCCTEMGLHFYARQFAVFNVAQVDDAPEVETTERAWTPVEGAERVIERSGLQVVHADPTRAFFSPSYPERVNVPPPEAFDTAEDYYGTLLHEATHWTGHESRLGREYGKNFGDALYAAEELVAELGATFVAGAIGMAAEPSQGVTAYLSHWLRMLEEGPDRLYTAAKYAQEAADYLLKGSAEGSHEPSPVQSST